jgi:hypothetical protein
VATRAGHGQGAQGPWGRARRRSWWWCTGSGDQGAQGARVKGAMLTVAAGARGLRRSALRAGGPRGAGRGRRGHGDGGALLRGGRARCRG